MLLKDGDVHVWQVRVDALGQDLVTCTLPQSEIERAEKFAFPHLSLRWRCGRMALRQILGLYLHTLPREISFGAGVRGKPFVIGPDGAPSKLEFNMSDAGDHVVVAVASGRSIGVDVEQLRDIEEMADIVERNFSELERRRYRSLPPEQKKPAFFAAWTRKEAYTKAVGLGLYLPLDSFSVSMAPDEPASLIEVDGSPSKAAGWTLSDIAVPAGHFGALVVRGRISKIETRTWNDATPLYPL